MRRGHAHHPAYSNYGTQTCILHSAHCQPHPSAQRVCRLDDTVNALQAPGYQSEVGGNCWARDTSVITQIELHGYTLIHKHRHDLIPQRSDLHLTSTSILLYVGNYIGMYYVLTSRSTFLCFTERLLSSRCFTDMKFPVGIPSFITIPQSIRWRRQFLILLFRLAHAAPTRRHVQHDTGAPPVGRPSDDAQWRLTSRAVIRQRRAARQTSVCAGSGFQSSFRCPGRRRAPLATWWRPPQLRLTSAVAAAAAVRRTSPLPPRGVPARVLAKICGMCLVLGGVARRAEFGASWMLMILLRARRP